MKLRNVLEQVILKLGMKKDIVLDEVGTNDEVDRLILAANNTIRELASCYLPLLMTERITILNGRYDLSSLSRNVVKVISIKTHNRNHPFKMYPTYMYADNGTYDITYSYLPNEINIDGDIECDSRVNEDILSNGIVSEYALMTGDIEKGQIYDRKYRENLKNLAITNREIRIKGRVFI